MSDTRRIGRPPATISDETRSRIIGAARDCFARLGYTKTTNKDIAALADITTGAIYHYFESKQALFAAVAEEVSEQVFGEFEEAVAREPDLVGQVRAVLDAASRLHENDRTLARFSAIFPIEIRRNPELQESIGPVTLARAPTFYGKLAAGAAERGELPAGLSVDAVADMLVTITIGLAYFGALTDSSTVHRSAVEALELVIARAFDQSAPPARRRGRRASGR